MNGRAGRGAGVRGGPVAGVPAAGPGWCSGCARPLALGFGSTPGSSPVTVTGDYDPMLAGGRLGAGPGRRAAFSAGLRPRGRTAVLGVGTNVPSCGTWSPTRTWWPGGSTRWPGRERRVTDANGAGGTAAIWLARGATARGGAALAWPGMPGRPGRPGMLGWRWPRRRWRGCSCLNRSARWPTPWDIPDGWRPGERPWTRFRLTLGHGTVTEVRVRGLASAGAEVGSVTVEPVAVRASLHPASGLGGDVAAADLPGRQR